MVKRSYRHDEIINKLREVEVLLSQGSTVGEASRKLGVSEHTYYRWRREYNQVRPHSALNYRPPAPETIAVDSNLTSGTINGGRSSVPLCS